MVSQKILFINKVLLITLLVFFSRNIAVASDNEKSEGLALIYGFAKGDNYIVNNASIYFYEDQPITFDIYIKNESSKVITGLGRSDWYNSIADFSYTQLQIVDGRVVTVKEKTAIHKIIKTEDLIDGKLGPGERKSIFVEILDENGMPFETGYYYSFYIKISFDNFFISCKTDSYLIEKITANKEHEKMWNTVQAHNAFKDDDYEKAILHYKKLMDLEESGSFGEQFAREWLFNAYERAEKYTEAKELALLALKFTDVRLEKRIAMGQMQAKEKGVKFDREKFLEEDKKFYSSTRGDNPYFQKVKFSNKIKVYEKKALLKSYENEKNYAKAKELLMQELNNINEGIEKGVAQAQKQAEENGVKFNREEFIKRESNLIDSLDNFQQLNDLRPNKEVMISPYKRKDQILEKIKEYDELMK